MPTLLGIIFLFLGLYFFKKKPEKLSGLLIVSSIFGAGSVVNFGKRGLQPFYLIGILLMAQRFLSWVQTSRTRRGFQGRLTMTLFAAVAILGAIILPHLFAGVPVYDPSQGIDAGLFVRPPLSFKFSNVVQSFFLIIDLAVVYIAVTAKESSDRTLEQSFDLAFYLLVSYVFVQAVFKSAGVDFFVDKLIRNNPGYYVTDLDMTPGPLRVPGTFSEPSMAGASLCMFAVGYLADILLNGRSYMKFFVSLMGTMIVLSSGSLAAMALVVPCLLLARPPYRLPWHLNLTVLKRVLIVLAPVVLVVLTVFGVPTLREEILHFTVDKGASVSFVSRAASDLYALQLTSMTHGLGVGLGSNRPSSLLTMLLSNVGVVGSTLFFFMIARLLKNTPMSKQWARWSVVGVILAMIFGVPDCTFPVMWAGLVLCVYPSRPSGDLTSKSIQGDPALSFASGHSDLGNSSLENGGPAS